MTRALCISALALGLVAGGVQAHPAIDAFTTWCFKAGQTPARALANMESTAGSPLPFDLTFWDTSLEPSQDAPVHAERRCEVSFEGDHASDAVTAVKAKMATPPVFGTTIPLPSPYAAEDGTAYIDGRELLRGRVAVVHIGTRGNTTFIGVDRLPAGMGLPE